jgi:hypothetical protein
MSNTTEKYMDAFTHLKDHSNVMNADRWTRLHRIGKQVSTIAIRKGYIERSGGVLKMIKMPTRAEVERIREEARKRPKNQKTTEPTEPTLFNVHIPVEQPRVGLIRSFIRWVW